MPRRMPPLPPPQPSPVNADIFRACAGVSVQIPMLHSRVYYFPQGHLDQAYSPPRNLSPLAQSRPYILCRVAAVNFFADPHTDEVFAKMLLHPLAANAATHQLLPPAAGEAHSSAAAAGSAADDDKFESYTKVLTPSDANNGGGFSVPRFCAELIFPKLNMNDDPPVQNLTVTDVHGGTWIFRHIYRGTPRRHLLTTGWSAFVNSKKLVASDSVVFMKDSNKSMFVGIRRAVPNDGSPNSGAAVELPEWLSEYIDLGSNAEEENAEEEEEEAKEGFSRDGRGRVKAKAVAEAMELAARNMPFEVVYYPRAGWSQFVVKAEDVDRAMSVHWREGMRLKMAKENDDSSRMTWHQGTISAVSVPNSDPWHGSPWRMLQVTWDEPEALKNMKMVSPWEVESISNTPTLSDLSVPFPPPKRFRAAEGDGELGDPFFAMRMEQLNPTFFNYGTYPAGMQGARHDLFSASAFTQFPSNNPPIFMGNHPFGNNTAPRSQLNIGSFPDDLSPDSQSSLPSSFGTEFMGTSNVNSTKPTSGSFQLFGAIIQTTQSVESDVHGTSRVGDDDNKDCNEAEFDSFDVA